MANKRAESSDLFVDKRLRAVARRIAELLASDARFSEGAGRILKCGCFAAALKFLSGSCEAVFRNQCRHRLCPVCATLKGARHRAALRQVIDERVAAGRRMTLMTLTLRHGPDEALRELLRVLFKALALFRKTVFFKNHFTGWARGIEVTWSEGGGYHPHSHFIVEAPFVDLDALHAAWAKCVRKAGGREVERQGVDLVGLKDSSGLNEAIGYPFKVGELGKWPAAQILELAAATKGRHLYQCCRKWSTRTNELEAQAEAYAEQNDLVSEVVAFREYVEDVRTGKDAACAAAASVLAIMARMVGLESSSAMLIDLAPPHVRHELIELQADAPVVALLSEMVQAGS